MGGNTEIHSPSSPGDKLHKTTIRRHTAQSRHRFVKKSPALSSGPVALAPEGPARPLRSGVSDCPQEQGLAGPLLSWPAVESAAAAGPGTSAGSWLGPAVDPMVILTGVLAPSSPSRSGGRLERWGRLPWKACMQTPEAWPQSGAQDHDPTVPVPLPGGHPGCCGFGGHGQGGERVSHAGQESGAQAGRGRKLPLVFLT